MRRLQPLLLTAMLACAMAGMTAAAGSEPVPVVIDTDMGNDIDDVFALGVLHALQSRGECRIVAVTVSKDHPLSAPFCDVLNTFYGQPNLPIGVLRAGKHSGDGPYLRQVMKPRGDGSPAFPHRLKSPTEVPPAVAVLRKELAGLKDSSAVVIAIGPVTNIRNLLDSAPDHHSALNGEALVAAKVRTLVVMAGDFSKPKAEFNVFSDLDAASSVFKRWPTELVACPFEIGEWVHYPELSLEKDFRAPVHHPLLAANVATFKGKRNGFMAWDLVAVLYAIRPDRNYVNLSKTGTVQVDRAGVTTFKEEKDGRHRYLIQRGSPDRVREALTGLASQPPSTR
jgi:purine nucleosidase